MIAERRANRLMIALDRRLGRLRLRLLLFLLVTIPLVVLAVKIVSVSLYLEEKALRQELETRAHDMTVGLAQHLAAAIRGEMPRDRYLRGFAQFTSVRSFRSQVGFVKVSGPDPRLDFDWQSPDLPELLKGENVRVIREAVINEETGKPFLDEKDQPTVSERIEYLHLLPVRAVLRAPDHSDAGTLEFGLSLLPLEERLRTLAMRQVAIALFVLVFSIVATLVLARRLSRPLEGLEEAALGLAAGGSPPPVREDEGSREIRGLTSAFNRMMRELEEKKRMALELRAARELQERLFPKHLFAGYKCRALFESRPANEVGGDFYTEIRWPKPGDPWLEIALGDVSGKGMGAALFAATTHGVLSSFRNAPPGRPDLVRHMTEVNRILCGETGADRSSGKTNVRHGEFVALLLVGLDLETGEGVYVNAGQIPPLIHSGELLRAIPDEPYTGDPPLGVKLKLVFHARSFRLAAGETLVLVSDGIIEAMNPEQEILDFGGLFAVGVKLAGGDLEARNRIILEVAEKHARGAPVHDDSTVILVERREG